MFRFPFHTYAFAIYFPVFLLSNNLNLFLISAGYRAVGVSLALAIALVVLFGFLYRDRHKAALVATAFIGLTYSYSRLTEVLSGINWVDIDSHWHVLLGLYCLISFAIAAFVYRMRSISDTTSLLLNVIAAVLLVIPLTKLAQHQLQGFLVDRVPEVAANDAAFPPLPRFVAPKVPPTIFHIVLDGYSRQDVLRRIYGYDNSEFIESLRDLGFFVADQATTPYGQTLLAMNAIFSMDYLDRFIRDSTADKAEATWSGVRGNMHVQFRNSTVRGLLEGMGYKVVVLEGDYLPVGIQNADEFLADERSTAAFNFFEFALLRSTPFYPAFLRLANLGNPIESGAASKVKYALASHDYSAMARPFFLYNHILTPHPPFDIDRNGNPRAEALHRFEDANHWFGDRADLREQYREGYLEKTRYTNRALLTQLKALINDYPDPKIIVVHGDHGGGLLYNHDDWTKSCLPERFSTLLAVFASDHRLTDGLSHDMNLVNLYRAVFSTLFGAELAPLADKHYFASWDGAVSLRELTREQVTSFGPVCTYPPTFAAD